MALAEDQQYNNNKYNNNSNMYDTLTQLCNAVTRVSHSQLTAG